MKCSCQPAPLPPSRAQQPPAGVFLHLAPGRPGPIRTWSATAAGVALAAAGLVPLVPPRPGDRHAPALPAPPALRRLAARSDAPEGPPTESAAPQAR